MKHPNTVVFCKFGANAFFLDQDFLFFRYGRNRIIVAFIDWLYGSMGYSKTTKKKFKEVERSNAWMHRQASKLGCMSVVQTFLGYPQYDIPFIGS